MSDAPVVLDASALLALLNAEPGADRVMAALPRAVVGAVNLSEVVAKLAEFGLPPDEVAAAVDGLGLQVVPFDAPDAYRAGLLRPTTRAAGLSLGDRACLALGASLGGTVLTTDRRWLELGLPVTVQMIR